MNGRRICVSPWEERAGNPSLEEVMTAQKERKNHCSG